MPIATSPIRQPSGITKLTNCRIVQGDQLVDDDLWFSSVTGKVLHSQAIFYEHQLVPDHIIDLGGRIVSPGFIDVQLNGGFGFDFSVVPDDISLYAKGVQRVNKSLITTGVTSYLPTLTSQDSSVYHRALPYLGPSGHHRNPHSGSESLGAHCEGPFLSPTKNGIHPPSALLTPTAGLPTLTSTYGPHNLPPAPTPSPIRLITLAPELPGALSCIPALRALNIATSIGHSAATLETALAATAAGATMITHLFNAMTPPHHRNPGIYGLLGAPQPPFFGLIADGIHLHPSTVALAYRAHPQGAILVSDAMALAGLPDGTYPWTRGSRIAKRGAVLTQEETGRIAGSAVQLVQCVNNFLAWTGAGVPAAVGAVTAAPARLLGLEGVKGGLGAGADADVVVLGEEGDEEGGVRLRVDKVWKFGVKVFDRDEEGEGAAEEDV